MTNDSCSPLSLKSYAPHPCKVSEIVNKENPRNEICFGVLIVLFLVS